MRSPAPALVLVLVLVLVPSPWVQALRSDRGLVPEENLGVTVNVTVLDGRGNLVQVMSSADGTYGQNSPRVDSRGLVLGPAPHLGGRFHLVPGAAWVYQVWSYQTLPCRTWFERCPTLVYQILVLSYMGPPGPSNWR